MIPWSLYNLTARDQGSPLIRPYRRWSFQTVPIGIQSAGQQFIVPDEHMLLVTHLGVWNNNTTDPLYDAKASVSDLTGVTTWEARVGKAGGNAGDLNLAGSPLLVLTEKEGIFLEARLTAAGTVPWTAYCSVAGVLVPKGTVAAL